MSERLTFNDFEFRARGRHGKRYDYSEVDYITNSTKVRIICNAHGLFLQRPSDHFNGAGCSACVGLQRKTAISFIKQAMSKHGDKYDYSNVEYIGSKIKVEIICKKHGVFQQEASSHLKGFGCPECAGQKKVDTRTFVEKSKQVHGDKYDYSLVNYVNSSNKVIIKCKTHGSFLQTPAAHTSARMGCRQCGYIRNAQRNTYPTSLFIERAKKIHGDKYDYTAVSYKGCRVEVELICRIHGPFKQTPVGHLNGKGCQDCGGTKKSTNAIFIERAQLVHGPRYDYSKVEYLNARTKVKLSCKYHGQFKQSPHGHLRGAGCNKCAYIDNGKKKKLSTSEFILKATGVHGNSYDYSKTVYHECNMKICIICKKHGRFSQAPSAHLFGQGCPDCAKTKKRTTESFIEQAIVVHGEKYNYSRVEYHGANEKVEIICKKHGLFSQLASSHTQGFGCLQCSGLQRGTTENFLEKTKRVHGDKYIYSGVSYVNQKTKVDIQCRKHGLFLQYPDDHISGSGCPSCSESSGEARIDKFLKKLNLLYVRQKRFSNCRNKRPLAFDFYIPSVNLLIEYDGEQHFRAVDGWGGEKTFKGIQTRDKIKTKYAFQHGFKLVRIKYCEYDKVEEVLLPFLKDRETWSL